MGGTHYVDHSATNPISSYLYMGEVYEKKREKLKEDVKRLIKEKSFADQLELFDSLQKLGVAYHFEEDIKYLLNLMKYLEEKVRMEFNGDVYVMALYFRLSRQHGFEISKDLLVKSYKYESGCFKPSVYDNIKGMLSLYEASFLAMDGEDEIDDAMEFALKHLNDFMRSNSSINPLLAQHIAMALELPLHHRIPKFQAQMFIEHSRHIKEINVDSIVLELGQLDFNMTQSIYKRELKEISKWWTNVSKLFNSKLNFARDWPVESYFLAVGMAVEPRFSTCRIELAKALCFINVIDDIYDIYGLLDELQLFTDAIDRWEFASIKSLPAYMKICVEGLFSMVNSLASKIMEEKGLDVLPNLKRSVKFLQLLNRHDIFFSSYNWLDLCKAYMVEARWCHTGYCPTFKEYLDNAWISVSTPLLSVIAHCLSENLTNLSLESFDFYPSIVRQSSIIFRLYNDLGTSKGELQRGDVSKSIQCYMKENHVSELVAQECIWNIIKKYWKELNREWIKGSRFEETFRMFAINVPRAGHLMYLQSNDGNIGVLNVEEMKGNIISLLLEPISLKQEEKVRMEFNGDVYVMALYFRLSRQHGFEISKDLLVKSYKYESGCFKPFVFHNIKGMLSLYEASFLAMDGEDEIDDAKEFALKHLNDFMRSNSSTNPSHAQHIAMALELPLHHRIPKFQAQKFIEHSHHIEEINMDSIVLELGQLDFNMTQSIYKRELKEISKWWTNVSKLFDSKLNFARDWPVESYFLAVGMAVEPRFSTCRIELAKALCFINVIDDIYDIYGFLDELQLFTDAIDRWEFASIKSLPEYMKICVEGLFSMVNSLASKIKEEKGLDVLPNLKRAWLDLCKAYMVEARWCHTGYCPTFKEYLDNAWISVSTPLLSVIAHCLSENLTNLSLESFDFYPSIVRQSSIIFRLYNDLGTSKGELQRGDVSKSI
ncbi:hypothetical protein IEQ34_002990 [Dendrobium chrysotoxum]|uniref:Uncharacterized protein n=1 Tax=Dendrobium chrysotoxum TaxID=161865 RepID=A0AAV7HJF5_DENCH|nr:hypothetical protein IEQ34_002990 [Dendrobium chrysotoxum]